MRFCGHHAVHSSDRTGGSLRRARGRESRVCDTCGRPRRSAASGRLGRRHSRGLGGRPAQGRAAERGARGGAPLACRGDRRDRRDVLGRRRHLAGRRAERCRRPAALGARRQRHHDRRARPGVRSGQPAERAGRHRAPADRAPAPSDVRRDLRPRRPRLQRQQLAPRRVRERDRLRHGPRGELLVRQLPHARRVRPGRRLHREHDQAEHRRALQLVPVRPLRRHRLVRAEGQPGGCGRHPLGQLGGQLPHPALGGRVERRRRRRQPRRAG